MGGRRVIGLDIGTSGVRAAEIEFSTRRRGGQESATLVRFGAVPLPTGAVHEGEVVDTSTVAGALKQLWRESHFASRDVVIGVGNQRVIVRELELPWQPATQLRASLPFQVQDLLPMAVEDALLDYFPTAELDGPHGRMMRGMLVAAQRETVRSNIRAVEAAGLRAVMVDLNAFALVRALARGDFAQRIVALVDIGSSVTTVAISAYGVPQIVRTIAAGGHDATAAVARETGLPEGDAEMLKREVGVGFAQPADRAGAGDAIGGATRSLVEAVRNTFVFYSGNHPGAPIEGVILTGGGAHLPGLGQYLASASRLPVAFGDSLASIEVGRGLDRAALQNVTTLAAMPVGLAYGRVA
ncbi:MAG TPA: type IV pilus assembly protein PilM [Cellulomonas sp.]